MTEHLTIQIGIGLSCAAVVALRCGLINVTPLTAAIYASPLVIGVIEKQSQTEFGDLISLLVTAATVGATVAIAIGGAHTAGPALLSAAGAVAVTAGVIKWIAHVMGRR